MFFTVFKKIINSCLLACFFLLFSCGLESGLNNQPPANILNEDVFTKLLVDFSLAESAANVNIKNVSVTTFDSVYAFNPLIQNKVRKSQYDSTVFYYSQNIELYKKIYESVLAQLNQKQAAKAGIVKDTIKR